MNRIFYFVANIFCFLLKNFFWPIEYFPVLSCFTLHIWIYIPFINDFFLDMVWCRNQVSPLPLMVFQLSHSFHTALLCYYFSEIKCLYLSDFVSGPSFLFSLLWFWLDYHTVSITIVLYYIVPSVSRSFPS